MKVCSIVILLNLSHLIYTAPKRIYIQPNPNAQEAEWRRKISEKENFIDEQRRDLEGKDFRDLRYWWRTRSYKKDLKELRKNLFEKLKIRYTDTPQLVRTSIKGAMHSPDLKGVLPFTQKEYRFDDPKWIRKLANINREAVYLKSMYFQDDMGKDRHLQLFQFRRVIGSFQADNDDFYPTKIMAVVSTFDGNYVNAFPILPSVIDHIIPNETKNLAPNAKMFPTDAQGKTIKQESHPELWALINELKSPLNGNTFLADTEKLRRTCFKCKLGYKNQKQLIANLENRIIEIKQFPATQTMSFLTRISHIEWAFYEINQKKFMFTSGKFGYVTIKEININEISEHYHTHPGPVHASELDKRLYVNAKKLKKAYIVNVAGNVNTIKINRNERRSTCVLIESHNIHSRLCNEDAKEVLQTPMIALPD